MKKTMTEDIKIGIYVIRKDERHILEKTCSCGHFSEAEYLTYIDVPVIHQCDACGNKNFVSRAMVKPEKRMALPTVFDIESSNRGFDLKKTNLSIIYHEEEKEIEVIQSNLIRRYVYDWVDSVLKVYRNGELEYDTNSEKTVGTFNTLSRVNTHLKKGLGTDTDEVIERLELEGQDFYKHLNRIDGDNQNYYSYKKPAHGFIGLLDRTLKNKERYNWVQILTSAGYHGLGNSGRSRSISNIVDMTATKPHKILCVSKKIASYIKESDEIDYYMIQNIQEAYNSPSKHKVLLNILDVLEDKGKIGDVASDIVDFEFLTTVAKYEPRRLVEYIFNEIHLYQGISNSRTGLTLLKDYITMCKEMEVPYEKYPKSLKREHDVTVINYQIFNQKKTSQDFEDIMMKNDYLTDEKLDKEYCIILPESSKDLVVEGGKLNHCVGSYTKKVEKGETIIAFLRKKKDMFKPLVTLEIRGWRVNQARGSSNRSVTKEEKDYITKWAESRQLQY